MASDDEINTEFPWVAQLMNVFWLFHHNGGFAMAIDRQEQVGSKVEEKGEEILIHLINDDNDDIIEASRINIKQEYVYFDNVTIKKESPPLRAIKPKPLPLRAIKPKPPPLRAIKPKPLFQIIGSQNPVKTVKKSEDKSKLIKKYLCNVCGGYFQLIRRHLESHGPHNCMDCLINFRTEEFYGQHLMSVHDNGGKRYPCDLCTLTFSSVITMAVHRFIHTKQYSCPLCKFTTKGRSRYSLVNHIKRHEGNFSERCEICGRGFMDKHMMAYHMEMHEAIPKYECEFCKKKFTVKRYLDVHKSYNHKKEMYGIEEMYQCEVCGRSFTFEKSLIRHLSCIHKIGKDRTRECPVCHKIISNNHNLTKHMRTHTGEKRFCCDTCGKAFSEKKYLNKHQRVHLKQRMRNPESQEVESDEDSYFAEETVHKVEASQSVACNKVTAEIETEDYKVEDDEEERPDSFCFTFE